MGSFLFTSGSDQGANPQPPLGLGTSEYQPAETEPRNVASDVLDEIPQDVIDSLLALFRARASGDPVTGLRAFDEGNVPSAVIHPFFDEYRGWALFVAVQLGMTALLAGDFLRARTELTSARFMPRTPGL